MKKLTLLFLIIAVTCSFISADVYIKTKTDSSGGMGQPASSELTEVWLGDGVMATVSKKTTTIVNINDNKMTVAYHATKSYIQSDLPMDIAKFMPSQMKGMMKGMLDGMTVSVTPNGKTKEIMQLNCKGYDFAIGMMGMSIKMVIWASTDVPFDWKKYSKAVSEQFKAAMRFGEKFVAEFLKIEGYQMGMEMEMMGMKVTSEVVEINPNKQSTPATYSVPEGYAKKEALTMQDMK